MDKKQVAKKLGKQTAATLTIPVIVYIIMLIACGEKGTLFNIFTGPALSSILPDTMYMTIVAFGIGFQLKYGRFDFCGGALIVVSAMLGAQITDMTDGGILVLVVSSVLISVVLSVINATVYS